MLINIFIALKTVGEVRGEIRSHFFTFSITIWKLSHKLPSLVSSSVYVHMCRGVSISDFFELHTLGVIVLSCILALKTLSILVDVPASMPKS